MEGAPECEGFGNTRKWAPNGHRTEGRARDLGSTIEHRSLHQYAATRRRAALVLRRADIFNAETICIDDGAIVRLCGELGFCDSA